MIPAALYPWIKALHLAAALLFVTGVMLGTAFILATRRAAPETAPMAALLVRWDRRVTVPAMLLAWALGLTLAASGHWLGQGWLNAKLALVVLLSGLHGVQAGHLRRRARGVDAPAARATLPLLVFCVTGIPILAVVKPF